MMQIKSINPVTFLCFRTETKVSALADFIPVGQQLIKEAVDYQLFVAGPVHWHYHGFTGDEFQHFTLEVALPVQKVIDDYDGPFHFKRTAPFRCLSLVHEGSWDTIPQSYGKLFEQVGKERLTPTAVNREVYINVDFENPAASVTEIQLGIV